MAADRRALHKSFVDAYGLMIAVAGLMYYLFRRRGIFRGPGR